MPYVSQSLHPRVRQRTWMYSALTTPPIVNRRAQSASVSVVEISRGGNPRKWIGRTESGNIVYPALVDTAWYSEVRNNVSVQQPKWSVICFEGTEYVVEDRVKGTPVVKLSSHERDQALSLLVGDLVGHIQRFKRLARESHFATNRTSSIFPNFWLLAPSHGDLNVSNVMATLDGSYSVLDWDGLYLDLLPLHFDLVSLLISLEVPRISSSSLIAGDLEIILLRSPHYRDAMRQVSPNCDIQASAHEDVIRFLQVRRLLNARFAIRGPASSLELARPRWRTGSL